MYWFIPAISYPYQSFSTSLGPYSSSLLYIWIGCALFNLMRCPSNSAYSVLSNPICSVESSNLDTPMYIESESSAISSVREITWSLVPRPICPSSQEDICLSRIERESRAVIEISRVLEFASCCTETDSITPHQSGRLMLSLNISSFQSVMSSDKNHGVKFCSVSSSKIVIPALLIPFVIAEHDQELTGDISAS